MYRKQAFSLGILLCLLVVLIISQLALPDALATPFQSSTLENNDYVFQRSWGGEGSVLNSPRAVAVGLDGTIYVTNTGLSRITSISPGERIFYNWVGSDNGDGQISWPSGIAVDKDGNIFITDGGLDRILKFTRDGTFLTNWGSLGSGDGQFNTAEGITVDENGDIYVADVLNHRIQKFTNNGTYLFTWGSKGAGNGQFHAPSDVVSDGNGNVYVADSNNARIQKFTSDGTYLAQWGKYGSRDGQFIDPSGIVVDGSGYILVAETGNRRIQKFTSDGTYITQWSFKSGNHEGGTHLNTNGIAVDEAGNVYLADAWSDSVQKFSHDGTYRTQWGSASTGEGQFLNPGGITVAENGNVFVADSSNARIQKFSSDGTYLDQWGKYGSGNGQFIDPRGIAVDRSSDIFVTETENRRIQKFTNEGAYLTKWGSLGSGNGQFNSPQGITVAAKGDVYVADTRNHRIQKFSDGGAYLTQWGNEGSGNGQFSYPKDIDINGNGDVYVADTDNHRIQKFSQNGSYLAQWGVWGNGDGEFDSPTGIAVAPNGDVFVADRRNDRIQSFNSSGTYLDQWGNRGSDEGQFRQPRGVAMDGNQSIYVLDTRNQRIQKFTRGYPTPDPVSGLVQNGSFDSSAALSEWTYGGSLPVKRANIAQHGSHALQLAMPVTQVEQDIGEAWAHQTIYVRPEWNEPMLYFHYRMFVNDIVDYSDFFVAIQDGVGLNHLETVLRAGYPSGPFAPRAGTDLGWRETRFDLSAYKGQHIRIVFSNRNLWPESLGIWTYLDDVRVVEADDLPPPPSTVFLPGQESIFGIGWRAGIQIQNIGQQEAIINYEGVEVNGNEVSCGGKLVGPGESANFLTDWDCPIGHEPFSAGVVRTDQPAAAITNVYNPGVGLAGGQYRAIDEGAVSKTIFFPLVKHNHIRRTTSFSVQNASDAPSDISAIFRVNGQTYTHQYNRVPAHAAILITPADAGVPGGNGQVGSLAVSGTQPLAGASFEYDQGVPIAQNLQTTKAFTEADYDTILYCPLYRNNHSAKRQTSGLQVQNVSDQSQMIVFTFTPVDGSVEIVSAETVDPGASATFYAPQVGIPNNALGSVTVRGWNNIAAVVNEGGFEADGRPIKTTYSCFPSNSTSDTVMVPLYKEFYLGSTTGIQIQNVAGNGSTATVRLNYRATNGVDQATFTHSTPISDGSSVTFWGVSSLSSPAGILATGGDPAALYGTYGSVMIESDKPIVAIVNETSFGSGASRRDAKNYEGFNQ